MKKENGRVDKMKKSKKDTCKRLIMFALALALLLSAPAASVQAASSTDKKLKKQVDSIVKKQVKDKDSKKKKLEKLFKYTEKTYKYGRAYEFKAKKGWEKTYALELFKNKKKQGSCYHFAAAYAVLAKKATNYTVRIGVGKTNGFNKKITQDHAWVEIKIKDKWYICDPNMDKFAEKSSGKYFLKERSKLKKVYNKFKKVKYTTVKL